MNENQDLHPWHRGDIENGSDSIQAIRDRIASVQSRELNDHLAEFDGIHEQLERALASIDGL